MVVFRRRRDLPDFWSRYEKSLRVTWPENIAAVRFVVLDTETTGFDFDQDRILSIGALSVFNETIPLDEILVALYGASGFNIDQVLIQK